MTSDDANTPPESEDEPPPSDSDDTTSSEGIEDDLAEVEERFIESGDDEELDEELRELVSSRERGSVLRPILMIAVVFLVFWVVWDWSGEIEYFFSSPDPVEIGSIANLPQRVAEDPDFENPIEHNIYASLQGMPTRITTGRGYKFSRLIGAEIYVQEEVESDGDSPEEGSSLPERDMGPGLPVDEHRQPYDGSGRLISFASETERVAGLKEHYSEHYNIRFCEDYSEGEIEDLERQTLEVFRANWNERYREASREHREQEELTPEPTEQQQREMLQRNPVCVDAYLLIDGERPVDYWWYVLFAVALSAFALFNVYKLIEWFRHWLEP